MGVSGESVCRKDAVVEPTRMYSRRLSEEMPISHTEQEVFAQI